MKFNTKQSDLLKALIDVSKVVPTRTTLPILSCALFETDEDSLKIRSTDLEQTIIIKIKANILEQGKVAVPINKMLEIVSALKNSNIEFSSLENEVEINSENGLYKIPNKDYNEYPDMPELVSTQKLTLTNTELLNIINNTAYAVSRDDLKPALCGVYLNIEKNKATAVATDGHRLVKYEKQIQSKLEEQISIIIPAKFLNIIKNSLNTSGSVDINISENHIDLTQNEKYLLSRIIKETFPDFNSVIPEDNPIKTRVKSKKILESIKRVSIFSNKTTKQIQLSFTENELTVLTEDKESNSSGKEYIECDHQGENINTRYNSQYLSEAISHINTEEVDIYLSSSQTAAVFKPTKKEDNSNHTALLMPLRSNNV